MQTVGSKSLNGIRSDNFSIRLEYNKDYVVVHLPHVDKFTTATFKEMSYLLEDWCEFFQSVGYEGIYAAADIGNTKIIRLATRLGFRFVGNGLGVKVFKYIGD